MAKRGVVFVFFTLLIFFILISNVGANFACGEIGDLGNLSSSWVDVQVYYSQNESDAVTCKTSPEDGKYCCDPLKIKSVNWGIGKVLNAKVSGGEYFAGPVSLSISGEGYDVFPTMNLTKGITLSNFSAVNIGDEEITFGISSVDEFNVLRYILTDLNGNVVREGLLCSECNEAVFVLNDSEKGQFEIEVIAENSVGDVISVKEDIWNLDYVEVQRTIVCEECEGNFVYSGETVNFVLDVSFSHEVRGEFEDSFPNEWIYLGNESYKYFSETHNSVVFEVEGNSAHFEYPLKAPNTILAKNYLFKSFFEGEEVGKSKITLYKFYKFFPLSAKFLKNLPNNNYYSEFESISPLTPAVKEFDDKHLKMVAIFPEEEMSDVYFFVSKHPPVKIAGNDINFMIGSNIEPYVKEVLVRYKVKKHPVKVIENVRVFRYDEVSDSWNEIEVSEYSEDEENKYYEFVSDKLGVFSASFEYRRADE